MRAPWTVQFKRAIKKLPGRREPSAWPAEMELVRAEWGMRALSLVLAAMAALLVGLDSETETVIFVARKATVKDLTALWYSLPQLENSSSFRNSVPKSCGRVMTIAASVTAGYHLLQLCRCMASAALGRSSSPQNKFAAWLQFLLDQVKLVSTNSIGFNSRMSFEIQGRS